MFHLPVRPRMALAWVALAAFLAGCGPGWPDPPPTRVEVVTDTLHGVEIDDPYRWLEDQDSPETRAWIEAQNAHARAVVGDTPLEARLRDRLGELMRVASVGAPRRAGDFEVFTLRRADEPQPRIVRRAAPEEDEDEGPRPRPDPEGDYEVLVDLAAMGFDDAASPDIVDIDRDGARMLYRIRDGGLDEISVRLLDVASGEELPDRLPEALYGPVFFDHAGEGFFYVHRSRSEGPRLRHHRIGEDASGDEEIFGEGYGPETFLQVREIEEGRMLLLTVQYGWARNEVYLMDRSSGSVHPVFEGDRAHVGARYREGSLFLRTNFEAPLYRVLEVPIEGVAPDGWADRSRWIERVPEQDHLLRDYAWVGDRVFVNLLADVSSRILVFEAVDGESALGLVGEVPLPSAHTATLSASGDSAAELTLASFAVPPTRYRLDVETFERERIEPPRPDYDGAGILVEQVWFTSKDGTRAPMYLVRKEGIEPDGDLPVLLHGYGGFNVSITPSFRTQAAVWVEAGGVFAVATLRGGSEYGEEWHRAGMLQNKQNVFDDFIAAAEWLIANGYTNPDRLAITGASNGGLLVASSFTQRPELYRAVFCGLPDLDMVRFFTFTDANNMPALLEYGNAGDPEQFAFLREYSPYQAVEDGVAYPAVMFTQGDLDTRVPPLQARKMTARVQAATSSGLPVILRYNPRMGHAGGRPREEVIRNLAMETAFLMTQLGMSYGED